NDLLALAQEAFGDAKLITTDRSEEGWKQGANVLFLTAAQYLEEGSKKPWLWLEPDAVPLKSGWLNTLEKLYQQANIPFLGFIYEFSPTDPPMAPFKLMSGVAIYPPDAWSRMAKAVKFSPNLAFDVACASITTDHGLHTNLIQHFYGEAGTPPT